MDTSFSSVMSSLRRERGLSQRRAAADLHISQALLSHYENGAREPGLAFVCRACEYYGVTADCLLGREERSKTEERRAEELRSLTEDLRSLTERAETLLAELGQ